MARHKKRKKSRKSHRKGKGVVVIVLAGKKHK